MTFRKSKLIDNRVSWQHFVALSHVVKNNPGFLQQLAVCPAQDPTIQMAARTSKKKPTTTTTGLMRKTTNLHVQHTFFVHFFAVFARPKRQNA